MAFNVFPCSKLIRDYRDSNYTMIHYDHEKMCSTHNWYVYPDMAHYEKLDQLISICCAYFRKRCGDQYVGSMEQKRLDSMVALLRDYKTYHRITDSRLFWKRMELIDKKIFQIE